MAKIGFHLNMNKKDKKTGLIPIRAKISVQSKAVVKNLPFKVKENKWNEEKQRVYASRENEKYNGYKEINDFLVDYTDKANQMFKDCIVNDTPLTIDLVRSFFNGSLPKFKTVKTGFWEAYDEFLKDIEITMQASTIRVHKSTKKKLENFEHDTGYKLTFNSITIAFFDKLKEYILLTKGHEYNYLPVIMRRVKAFMNWSLKRGYHNCADFKSFSVSEKEGSIIYLTFDELQHLINFQFENRKYQRVRDFYCFGCLTGARYSDLKRLTKDNIADGKLKFTTQKTNIDITIPIFPGLSTIIDRYPDQHRLLPKYSGQKANEYIKKACEKAEIKTLIEVKTFLRNETIREFRPKHELIGTHTARKTFICLAHARGVDIKTIMDITGIKSHSTLKRYLDVSIDTKMDSLTKMYGGLIHEQKTEPEVDETLEAMRQALLQAGFDADKIDNILSQSGNIKQAN